MLYTVLLLWHFVGHLLAEYVVTVSRESVFWPSPTSCSHFILSICELYRDGGYTDGVRGAFIAQSVCGLVWDRKWLEDANTDFPGSDVFVQVDITDSWRDLCCAGLGSKRIVNKVKVLRSNHTYLCFCSRLFPTWCQRCHLCTWSPCWYMQTNDFKNVPDENEASFTLAKWNRVVTSLTCDVVTL